MFLLNLNNKNTVIVFIRKIIWGYCVFIASLISSLNLKSQSDGNQNAIGQAILLKFSSIRGVNNFMTFYQRIIQDTTTL